VSDEREPLTWPDTAPMWFFAALVLLTVAIFAAAFGGW
jgi:hypothetical protein